MRKAVLASLFGLALTAATGCQQYVAVPNSGADRIWIITKDGTEVFRCWDLKNQTRQSIAICRHAEMLGKSETTKWSSLADSTAPPAHSDSEGGTAPKIRQPYSE